MGRGRVRDGGERFGIYDFRHVDLGPNLRAKGVDGYTPIGPTLIDARRIDPGELWLRTWVDGGLVQEARTGDELLFGFGQLVADLSRLMTLEPGYVILTGTPPGSSVVRPGSVVEGTDGRSSPGRLSSPVVADDHPLEAYGAMPYVDAKLEQLANGQTASTAFLSPETRSDLEAVSTATLASQLSKRGLHGCVLDGLCCSHLGAKVVGTAKTLEYLPLREDEFAERGRGFNSQKRAVEEIGAGEVLVIGARADPHAGTIGDILALRVERRGAAGIVTDGAVRDRTSLSALKIPTFYAATNPAVLGRRHVPWDVDVAVACAGALVQPGDVIVGDSDGVVVVPPSIAAELAAAAVEQELEERFVAERVAEGAGVEGLFPIGPRWRAQYEEWRRAQSSPNRQPAGRERQA
jgi:regulator of RNase E activity RraA